MRSVFRIRPPLTHHSNIKSLQDSAWYYFFVFLKSSNESSNGIVRNLLELFYALFLLLKILFIVLADFSLAEVSKCAYILAVVLYELCPSQS